MQTGRHSVACVRVVFFFENVKEQKEGKASIGGGLRTCSRT